jgi:hypothetical protein
LMSFMGTLLVPMNDINVLWHAHLSCSYEYRADCAALLGYILPHDIIAVEDRAAARRAGHLTPSNAMIPGSPTSIHAFDSLYSLGSIDGVGEDEQQRLRDSLGLPSTELAELSNEELAALLEKRSRGLNVKESKQLWEEAYGTVPRYDLPDTLYRGEPTSNRGGFHDLFVATNGSTSDISWPVAFVLMLLATSVTVTGIVVAAYAFYLTLLSHGKYFVGVPAGLTLVGLGIYLFLAIPINRPLSSEAGYWHERSLKETHNPLPPYLISSTKSD